MAEGSYFSGAAALINSLVHAGFEGLVLIGYRGPRPSWLSAFAHSSGEDVYQITGAVRLKLVEVGGPWHLNNCKPIFIRSVLAELCPKADLVYYFDTDIVITGVWKMFASWAQDGVVMALDPADSNMSPHHAYRRAWQKLAAQQHLDCRDVTGYVNGGCVGIGRAHAEFADVWSRLMEELERQGADMSKMKTSAGPMEFARMDQDVLNATIMATRTPVAFLGCESMGMFPWLGLVMPHAMFGRKPWLRNYVIDALRGFPPGRVHKAYWKFANDPIKPFGAVTYRLKRLQLAAGNAIGLLHMRSYRDL
jgi:hypothetical protein